MPRRGRKPKPTATHVANGNPSKLDLEERSDEPQPAPGGIVVPEWARGDVLRVWEGITTLLQGMGVMTRADCQAVGRYCDAIVLWQRAALFLRERGSTYPIRSKDPMPVTNPDGTVSLTHPVVGIAQYPQVAEYRLLSKLLLAFEAEFGLTPSARTQVRVTPEPRNLTPEDRERREFFKHVSIQSSLQHLDYSP